MGTVDSAMEMNRRVAERTIGDSEESDGEDEVQPEVPVEPTEPEPRPPEPTIEPPPGSYPPPPPHGAAFVGVDEPPKGL